ncbi:hypothetical protein SADUNF_Sadunf14G0000200 [Salix dunnii]|uniref:Uncharacterized protein n=1 Tax=Salix dunnii TaxID=1413687 RepID=A0A835MPC2_9ROSI|nr:hypothetical protein SADUNF_Sadunf14G0000200 [Salix dunnii]
MVPLKTLKQQKVTANAPAISWAGRVKVTDSRTRAMGPKHGWLLPKGGANARSLGEGQLAVRWQRFMGCLSPYGRDEHYRCLVQLVSDKGLGFNDHEQEGKEQKMKQKEQAINGGSISAAASLNKGGEPTHCSVNKVASLQSHSVEEEKDSSIDSMMMESCHDNRDVFPLAFMKVKKKRGGKKKGKGASHL